MTGYQEIYTDPSYFGQIVINTNVHIGNYGTLAQENESNNVQIKGMICQAFSEVFSRGNDAISLQKYLENANITAITDIDTRALVQHIRKNGAMNAVISSEIHEIDFLKNHLENTPNMAGLELASHVSTQEPYYWGNSESKYKVAVLDFGIKKNILRNFEKNNLFCKVFPAKTTFQEMELWQPNAYFLSNGPGDPAPMQYAIDTAKAILNANKPLFGICLGQQLLALAVGLSTYKLHHGHRGLNHPVKNLETGKCEMTSQNHGFGVSEFDVAKSKHVKTTHINLNDNSIEGLRVMDKPAFSVQYHPEASPGTHDSEYLFKKFVEMMN